MSKLTQNYRWWNSADVHGTIMPRKSTLKNGVPFRHQDGTIEILPCKSTGKHSGARAKDSKKARANRQLYSNIDAIKAAWNAEEDNGMNIDEVRNEDDLSDDDEDSDYVYEPITSSDSIEYTSQEAEDTDEEMEWQRI